MKKIVYFCIVSSFFLGSVLDARPPQKSHWDARAFGWSHHPGKLHKRASRETVSEIEAEADNWYVRLTAEVPARGLSTENTQIGQLDRSDASAENLKAIAPFGGGYLDIVVVEAGTTQELKGSFHPYTDGGSDTWYFTVKTDDAGSNVILSWRGLYVLSAYEDTIGRLRYRESISKNNPLLAHMQVVDVATGETVPIVRDGGKSYIVFNMDGSRTRAFRWELLPYEAEATEGTTELNVQYARSLFKRYEDAKAKKFDLGKPPVEHGPFKAPSRGAGRNFEAE